MDTLLVRPPLLSQLVCLSLVVQLRRKWRIAWPGGSHTPASKCLHADDCYVDYIDGEYFLFDLLHPGVRIALIVLN